MQSAESSSYQLSAQFQNLPAVKDYLSGEKVKMDVLETKVVVLFILAIVSFLIGLSTIPIR